MRFLTATSSTGLDEEQFRFALQRRAMLAIEVVCDVLHWYVLSVHTVHGTRKAVVIHLRKEILAKIVLHVSPVRCRSHNGICQLNIKILTVKNIKSCVFTEYSS